MSARTGPAASRRRRIKLALDLALDPRYGGEDFLVGPSNEQAHALIESWPDWSDRIILIEGPPGSGKTHLRRDLGRACPCLDGGCRADQHGAGALSGLEPGARDRGCRSWAARRLGFLSPAQPRARTGHQRADHRERPTFRMGTRHTGSALRAFGSPPARGSIRRMKDF